MTKVRTRIATDGITNSSVTYAKIQDVSATDKLLGRSTAGAGVIEEVTCTSFARTILDDSDASTARATLGVTIGTHVQAYDAELAALAGVTSAADALPYFTGSGTATTTTLTSFGRTLIDDADAAAARATLSVQPTASPAFTGAATVTNDGNVVPLTVTNTGTANSFVVNDASGDTSPFVIDASGNVGIGASSPGAALDVGSGNLRFSSTAQRITGDFSNATISNRLMFQSITSNGNTSVRAITNGTATTSNFAAHNGSDANNTSFIAIQANPTETIVNSGSVGTGTNLPLTFYTGGTAQVQISTVGQLLVTAGSAAAGGVSFSGDPNTGIFSPLADNFSIATSGVERLRCTSGGTIEVRVNAGSVSHLFAYNENGGEIILYDETQTAATLIDQISTDTRVLELVNGSNLKLGLGSGNTTGSIQFMRAGYQESVVIASDGNVRIRTGADINNSFYATKELAVIGSNSTLTSGAGNVQIWTNDAQAADRGGMITLGGKYASAADNSGDARAVAYGVIKGAKENSTAGSSLGYLTFATNDGTNTKERMRIDSSGRVGIGAAANSIAYVHIDQTAPSSGGVTQVVRNTVTIPSGTTSGYWTFLSAPTTQAASFTLNALRHFVVDPQAFGAGSTVTNQYGYIVESTMTGATNNYGFYSDIASGTGRFNFYANGTATNYFNGSVGIGTASISSGFKVDVRGRLLSYTTSTDGLITVQGLQTESSGTGKSAIQIDVNGKGGFAWQNDASSGTRALRLLENSGYGAGDTTALLYSGGAFTFNRRVDITQGTTTGAQAHCYVRPENGGLGRDSQITFGCTFSNGWGGGDLAARDAGAIRFGANGGSSDPRDWSMRFLVADGPGGSDTPRECMRINTYGNVGIGVTPPAGTSTTSRLHVATDITLYGASRGFLGNVYFDGAWKYASTGYGWAWVDSGSGNIDFARTSTSGTAGATATFLPAMRINDASEVLIGTTTDQGNFKLQVGGNTYLENLYLSTTTNWGRLAINHAGATTFAAGWNNTDTSSTGQTTLNILRNGASVGTISTTNVATSYNTTSDYRLKANPRPLPDATERLSLIQPRQWDWHVGGVGEGFIAHELVDAVPLAVTGEKDAVDASGNPVWQTVDMSKVVPLLVAALQEANARIAALEERLNDA